MSIFGIGTVVVDHAVVLSGFPERDTKNAVQHHWQQIGGPVPVALSTAAFYGERCTFLGRWGRDAAGQLITEGLSQRGIDIGPSATRTEWSTGFAQVWTEPSGSRTIAYSRGNFPAPSSADVDCFRMADHAILHLDGWAGDAAIAAAKRMKEQGGIVVLDAGSVKPRIDELLPFVDVLIASALFRQSRFGSPDVDGSMLLDLGCGSVITTHGQDGAVWTTASDEHSHPGYEVDAIDTNGAGDVFSGAILHSLSRGMSRAEALSFACAVAAFACGHFGNFTLPSVAEMAGLSVRNDTRW